MRESFADPGKEDRFAHGVPVVPAFDGYRAYAVMGIVLFHLLATSGLLLRAGESIPAQVVWGTLPYAISVFFIVSGFVMFLPTAARDGKFGSVSTFAVRRAARLFPAFWVVLVISLLLLALVPDVPAEYPFPGVGEIALNFSGQQAWSTLVDPGYDGGFGVATPIWTLTLEIGFYVVLPFVAASYFRRPLLGLAIAAAISIIWRYGFANIEEVTSLVGITVPATRVVALEFADNQLPHWAYSFGAGMTVAWAYVRLRERYDTATLERGAIGAGAAALLALAVCVFFAGRYATNTPPAVVVYTAWNSSPLVIAYTTALATLMLAIAFAPSRLQVPFSNPAARLLADISYGVYLIHAVILWVIVVKFSPEKDGSIATFAILSAIVLPLSCAYGYLSARFVEQPIRRWAHHLGRRAQAKRAGAEGAPATSSSGLPG